MSWLDKMRNGEIPPDWPAGHEDAVAEMLTALGERARHTREVAGLVKGSTPQPDAGTGFTQAADLRLPVNRKEKYFTGTVLPALISDNGFIHLHRFLGLCGLFVDDVSGDTHPLSGRQDLQFFTEYAFAESVQISRDRQRFADRPHERDTPDLVLTGPDWLLAVEAKMYHRPTRQALEKQIARQRTLVNYWTTVLGLNPARVAHVLLLPEPLAQARGELAAPVVTWEAVRDAYAAVAPAYWLGVIRDALARYDELASPEPTFRTNADALIRGEDIVQAHASDSLSFAWMGRSGGMNGAALARDLANGQWRDREYEVRAEPLTGNPYWFPISDSIARTSTA